MDYPCALKTEPVLDRDELFRRCTGKLDLVERVLDRFCSRFELDLAELEQAVFAEDLETVARVAHRIKGASASIAAHGIRTRVAETEDLARRGEPAGVLRQVEGLRQEWARFQGEFPGGRYSIGAAETAVPCQPS